MPLTFIPDSRAFFLWGESPPDELGGELAPSGPEPPVGELFGRGVSGWQPLVTAEGRVKRTAGRWIRVHTALAVLATIAHSRLDSLPPSIAAWSLAAKLALELLARERVLPRVVQTEEGTEARWVVAISAPDDATRVAVLAKALPPAAHAVAVAPVAGPRGKPAPVQVWAPDAILMNFLNAAADMLVRGDPTPVGRAFAKEPAAWELRILHALTSSRASFYAGGFAERTLLVDLERWVKPALGSRADALRACFRLEMPQADEPFALRFLLQAPDDPSLLVPAADVWKAGGRTLTHLGRAFADPQETLLAALGIAARLFPPITECLKQAQPEALRLGPAVAWGFLSEAAPALAEAGFGVIVPAELTAAGQRRLRLRMRIGAGRKVAGAVAGRAALGLDELVNFQWEAALGEQSLSAAELAALAKHKSPLVRLRGQWVAVDPHELAEIRKRLEAGGRGTLPMRDALAVTLAGEAKAGELSAAVLAEGALSQVLDRLRTAASDDAPVPEALQATLRPYQARGLAWLRTMARLGLGACLADDMGLGKTVQVLAFLLDQRKAYPADERPVLLVAPTSVAGNWEREMARFAPSLPLVRHYGPTRAQATGDLTRTRGAVVLTTYGLLRRDAPLLASVDWTAVILDEAQAIKNAASTTTRAARSLRAAHRFALTGTPVENRLAELWSILEFANPGILGPLETFRREMAIPIERYGSEAAAARLRRIVGPFLLRRVKSDPAIIQDLPPKNEMKVICTLTREQATLYQAAVNQAMGGIEASGGIQRRGLVLSLLMGLKQICNHPAQYLGEAGPLRGRSGKLARTTEMLDEALSAGDRALVFTQFREMGDRLVSHLHASLGVEVIFLHGGTPKRARDEMVRRFQDDPRGPRIFVLSLKAGGTGLNLTAASHVFHYDRWWNPAVEDQATDRAYRIGQKRAVQVHKLLCAGTVEEKVDAMLERKRDLAARVVGTGENWITEMGNAQLRELFALSKDAVVSADDGDDEPDEAAATHPAARRAGSMSSRTKKRGGKDSSRADPPARTGKEGYP